MHTCPNCLRHIRESECPFCHTVSDAPAPASTVLSGRGLSRRVLVASVVLAGACSSAYGLAVDSGNPQHDAAQPSDAQSDVQNPPDSIVAAYGIPPDAVAQDDAASDVQSAPDAIIAAYGIPPDQDAGGEQ